MQFLNGFFFFTYYTDRLKCIFGYLVCRMRKNAELYTNN